MPDVTAVAGPDVFQPSKGLDGRPFTALLLEDDFKRASALSVLLSGLARSNVRVVRMGSSVRSRLTLEHILLQATDSDGSSALSDNTRRIVRTIAERQGQEMSVALLIMQAETLHSRTLRLLQDMAPYFAEDAAPTLQVVFVGRPTFRDLLHGRDMAPLRQALGFPAYAKLPEPPVDDDLPVAGAEAGLPWPTSPAPLSPSMEPAAGEPLSRPSPARRGSLAVRLISLLAVIAMGIGAGALGVHALFYRAAPAPRRLTLIETRPESPPDTLPPTPVAPATAAPALATRPVPSKQRSLDESALANPVAMLNPRVVIHMPAGSEASVALSAHLLTSLGSHPGTVELRRVAETPTRPSIRYFYPEDEPVARQVAARMTDTGLPWTLRDFSTFLPRPSRGTIEIWLPRL